METDDLGLVSEHLVIQFKDISKKEPVANKNL